ncbi:MAG TPA: sensor histidine kinase [Actinomycetota bacterium]|nr:sensor histidine kinase [Actinomycetota bacterium]
MSTASSWRPRLGDVALAALLAGVMEAGSFGTSHHLHAHRPMDAAGGLLILAIAGALAFRRRQPAIVLGAVSGLLLVYFLIGYGPGPVWLALLVAYATAVVHGQRLAAGIAAVVGFSVFPWLDDWLGRGPAPNALGLTLLAAGLLVLFGAAEAVRARRARRDEERRRREEEAARTATEERLRIARDLHDVLAHNISLISVQAGVALHVNGELPDQARSALTAIRAASKEALGELRSALDALRQTGDAAPHRPSPGLAQLDDLVAGARAAGLHVAVSVEGVGGPVPVPVPVPVDVAAYRIVQEALTNVIRHAGAGSAEVTIRRTGAALVLTVEDDGHGSGAGTLPSPGSGILGMRERAAALGGTLNAGPRPGGGFRVHAELPAGAPVAAEPGQ